MERTTQDKIYRLTHEDLTVLTRTVICASDLHLFWSDDWSCEFYQAQAQLGFISTATRMEDGSAILLPELQPHYAILDWDNISLDRGLRGILNSGRLESENIRLVIDKNPEPVLDQLQIAWGKESWILPEYADLMMELYSRGARAPTAGFSLWGVRLEVNNETAAGELGYSCGRVYTSLSGFFHRGRRGWNHFGKLQMSMLASHLREKGMEFWNMGHPYMEYKTKFGATIVQRNEFIRRLDGATSQPVTVPMSLF